MYATTVWWKKNGMTDAEAAGKRWAKAVLARKTRLGQATSPFRGAEDPVCAPTGWYMQLGTDLYCSREMRRVAQKVGRDLPELGAPEVAVWSWQIRERARKLSNR